jgi:hypothetical protein
MKNEKKRKQYTFISFLYSRLIASSTSHTPLALAHLASRKELVDLTKAKNLFVMEAMWTRFFPANLRVKELLTNKAIGDIQYLFILLPLVLLPHISFLSSPSSHLVLLISFLYSYRKSSLHPLFSSLLSFSFDSY